MQYPHMKTVMPLLWSNPLNCYMPEQINQKASFMPRTLNHLSQLPMCLTTVPGQPYPTDDGQM